MFSWTAQINTSLIEAFNTFLKSNQAQLVSFVVVLLYFASLLFQPFCCQFDSKAETEVLGWSIYQF